VKGPIASWRYEHPPELMEFVHGHASKPGALRSKGVGKHLERGKVGGQLVTIAEGELCYTMLGDVPVGIAQMTPKVCDISASIGLIYSCYGKRLGLISITSFPS
jgi:hypothetical protein